MAPDGRNGAVLLPVQFLLWRNGALMAPRWRRFQRRRRNGARPISSPVSDRRNGANIGAMAPGTIYVRLEALFHGFKRGWRLWRGDLEPFERERSVRFSCGRIFGVEKALEKDCILPDLVRQVDDIVFPLDKELEGPSLKIVSSLRRRGRSVDLIQDKRLKWVFKHTERINADRLILVGNSEWQRGVVRVKILATRDEFEIQKQLSVGSCKRKDF